MRIDFDLSAVPSDVALFLAQDKPVEQAADRLAVALGYDWLERCMLRDELVGTVAGLMDEHLPSG